LINVPVVGDFYVECILIEVVVIVIVIIVVVIVVVVIVIVVDCVHSRDSRNHNVR
jgi:uncharacterized membrane protein